MPLPRVQSPTAPILVPSLKRAHRFSPFTVKEEKILLMAKESDEPAADQLRAIHQVVVNCSVDEDLRVDDLATFDLEWLWLKLREISVGSRVVQGFYDREEMDRDPNSEPYTFDIDLSQVKAPVVPDDYQGFAVFNLENEARDSVMLRYPPASLYTDPEFARGDFDSVLYKCTMQVTSGAQTFREFTKRDVVDYFDSWPARDMKRVREFIDEPPTMSYEIEYKNKLGNDRKIRLTSLTDFFTF
jgi:hypothetical protein